MELFLYYLVSYCYLKDPRPPQDPNTKQFTTRIQGDPQDTAPLHRAGDLDAKVL